MSLDEKGRGVSRLEELLRCWRRKRPNCDLDVDKESLLLYPAEMTFCVLTCCVNRAVVYDITN